MTTQRDRTIYANPNYLPRAEFGGRELTHEGVHLAFPGPERFRFERAAYDAGSEMGKALGEQRSERPPDEWIHNAYRNLPGFNDE